MRVSLLSPYSELSAIGVRTISACLKAAGIKTRIFFLPLQGHFSSLGEFQKYPMSVVESLAGLLEGDDLIGISVMSNYHATVADLTRSLRKMTGVPIVWGGVHPTVSPEQCIREADYICIGEGEKSFLDLCRRYQQGLPTDSIPGIWSRDAASRVSSTGAVIMDLDSIPFQDYDLEENYILRNGRLVKVTGKNIQRFMGVTYWTNYTRGCPYQCSYCCNNALRSLNPDLTRLRVKSPGYIVNEVNSVRKRLPFIKYVYFSDDTLFALPALKIKKFCELYKREVGLPFVVSGVEPTVFSEDKFDYMVDAGMIRIRMGIQSGSETVLKQYNRGRQDNDMVRKVAGSLQKYSDRMALPAYDIILDNPWESDGDTLKTINLLAELKPPFTLNVFSLTFFPGTGLYKRAVSEGLVSPGEGLDAKHYHMIRPTYLNFVVALFGVFKVPGPVLRFLLAKRRIKNRKVLRPLVSIVERIMFYRRGLASLSKRDYSMFPPAAQMFFCKLMPPRQNKQPYIQP